MSAIYCGVTAVIEVNDLMSMDASYDCLVDIIKSDPGAFTECGPILDLFMKMQRDVVRIETGRHACGIHHGGGYC